MIGELRGKEELYAWTIILCIFLILGVFTEGGELAQWCIEFASNLLDVISKVLGVLTEII